jgi:hypothetical protein
MSSSLRRAREVGQRVPAMIVDNAPGLTQIFLGESPSWQFLVIQQPSRFSSSEYHHPHIGAKLN